MIFSVTEVMQQFPYFSDFSLGTTMDIDKPFIDQVIHGFDTMDHMSTADLCDAITTAASLCMSSNVLCEELVWQHCLTEEGTLELFEVVEGGYKVRNVGFPLYSEMLIRYPKVSTKEQISVRWGTLHFDGIARSGNLRLLQHGVQSGHQWCDDVSIIVAQIAAGEGHLPILRYLHDNNYKLGLDVVTFAVTSGSMDMVRYLHDNNYPWKSAACTKAARCGYMEILKYLHDNGCEWDIRTSFFASEGGGVEVLKYLAENGCPRDDSLCMRAAAGNNHIDVLQYFYSVGCVPFGTLLTDAASRGCLLAVKHLHETGCPWNDYTFTGTVKNGNLEVIKYLHENGCPWDAHTFTEAASAGRIEVCKYLNENGCPRDHQACFRAAQGDHLDVIKYLHENGCPWDVRTFAVAFHRKNFDVIKYLYQNGCPRVDDTHRGDLFRQLKTFNRYRRKGKATVRGAIRMTALHYRRIIEAY